MSKPIIKEAWWVVPEDGVFYIHNAKGERVYGEIFCRVHDEQGSVTTALVKMIVNIAGSEKEMMDKISNP